MFLEWWPKLTFSIFAWNKIWLVNHFLYSIGHRRSNYLWKNCLLEQLTLFQESILQSFLWYYLNNTFSVFLGVGLIHILAFYTHTRAELCNERIHKNKKSEMLQKVSWLDKYMLDAGIAEDGNRNFKIQLMMFLNIRKP